METSNQSYGNGNQLRAIGQKSKARDLLYHIVFNYGSVDSQEKLTLICQKGLRINVL